MPGWLLSAKGALIGFAAAQPVLAVAGVLTAGLVAGGAILVAVGGMPGASAGSPGLGTQSAATAVPPAPALSATPSNPTSSTDAHFQYADAQNTVTFQCRLDGAARKCGSSANYSALSLGTHTFCVEAVDKAAKASLPTCFSWTIVSATALPFSIGGTGQGLFYPGGSRVPVNLVISNPNTSPITLTSVTATITGTSARGCSVANFAVVAQLSATPTVAAGSTVSLSALGVPVASWPQLQMIDSGNQDACKGATVSLAFAGTASG